MWWRLLALACLFQKPHLGRSQTCPAAQQPVKVGSKEGSISVPVLTEGDSKRWACAEFFQGYDSFIEVSCLGGILHADSSRCTEQGCKAGQQAPARMGGVNKSLFVTVVYDFEHGGEAQVPCSTILDGYEEVVELSCKLGNVEADAGKCRPPFQASSTMWRVVNGDFLAGTWRVFEVSFHTSTDCQSGQLEGAPVASSEDQKGGGWKQLAFDRDLDTAWSAHCELGCMAETAWIGLNLPQASTNVRCVKLRQSKVRCCGSDRVRLQVWDGKEFQSVQVWDTRIFEPEKGYLVLPIPITCVEGKPVGEGVVHDCDGPPVVGRQAGDTCTAQCETGYYGTPEEFDCRTDGSFKGNAPSCYELAFWLRVTGMVSFWGTLMLLSWQYKFWCMYKKARLTDEEVTIPSTFKGKWLEASGRHVWDDLQKAVSNKELEKEQEIGKAMEKEMEKKAEEGGEAKQRTSTISRYTVSVTEDTQVEAAGGDELEEYTNMVVIHGKIKEMPPSTDGLCTPCIDPDLCWTCILCPLCRIADTWHTLGTPSFLTYGRVFMLYLCCPCCWPCFNFFGRLRIRMLFGIPLEPHRDCLAHGCCCCCCSPCAICQEARLVDAPTRFYWGRKKQKEIEERIDF